MVLQLLQSKYKKTTCERCWKCDWCFRWNNKNTLDTMTGSFSFFCTLTADNPAVKGKKPPTLDEKCPYFKKPSPEMDLNLAVKMQ
jgi:hypothetical protein